MSDSNTKTTARTILKNLIFSFSSPRISSTVEEGVADFKDYAKDLEAIHIYIDNINLKHCSKKKYFHIEKLQTWSRLDEWTYKNLITNEDFAKLLSQYQPLKEKLGFDDIDEYILSHHYRPKAVETLGKKYKKFDIKKWSKKRYRFECKRKTNLKLKDGRDFRFDFRNHLETLFVINRNGSKEILAVGGSGSSWQRQSFTVATTVFYLLDAKRKIIPHHLLRYDSSNRFHYIGTYYKPILDYTYGNNYSLDSKLQSEIGEYGISFRDVVKDNSQWISKEFIRKIRTNSDKK